MRKLIVLILMFIFFGVIAQKKNEIPPPRPAIPINSLQLNIQLIEGKEFYSFINSEKKKIKNKKEYVIWQHEKIDKKKHRISYNNEGDDIPSLSSNFIKGKYTSLNEVGSFNNGYKNGFWKTLFKNRLVKTINYNNGLIIGKYRIYNIKGELLYKTTFGLHGNGKFKDYYYKTGVLKKEGNYKNGKQEGEWCMYNQQGHLTKIIHYQEGLTNYSKTKL